MNTVMYPDSAYEDYQEAVPEKAMDEYLPDIIDPMD